MAKSFFEERGSTLMLVLGVVLVVSVLVVPLTLTLNTSLNQSVHEGNYEKANAKSESIASVYRRLLQDAITDGLQSNDLRTFAEDLLKPPYLFEGIERIEVLPPEPAVPNAIEITTASGEGPNKRLKTVVFHFRFQPASGNSGGNYEGPGENSTGDEFYHQYPAVVKPAKYKGYYKVCDSNIPPDPEEFVSDTYSEEKYEEEFNAYIAYYLNQMDTAALKPKNQITPSIPAGSLESISYNNASGTIEHDLITSGNISFNNHTGNLTINGDLIAAGNITFNGIGTLVVRGDIIAGGNITFNNWSSNITIEGTVSAKNIHYGGGQSITIGKWNTNTNTILDDSFSSLIAEETFRLNGQVTHVRVSGDFSSGTFDYSNREIKQLRVGGSFLTGNDLAFASKFEVGLITGNMSVGKSFDMSSVGSLKIGQSLYIGEKLTFGNDITELEIGGSLFTSGNMEFKNFISKLQVAGDLIVNGDMDFKDIRDRFQVGGLLAILGDLTFTNHLPYAEDINRFGGFYVGGTMDMPSWVNQNGRAIFCINHNPPPVGGSQSTIEFGNWIGN